MDGEWKREAEGGGRGGGIHFAAEHPLKCETRDFPTRLSSNRQREGRREEGQKEGKR